MSSDEDYNAPEQGGQQSGGEGGGAVDAVSLWLMRLLAVVGLGIAGFLSWITLAAYLAQRNADVPLCGGLGWFACDSVLNSPWSKWVGIPVAAPAAAAYLGMFGGLLVLSPKRTIHVRRSLWLVLCAGALCIAGAGGWFIYIQLARLGHICIYCMAEHIVGLALGALIWYHAQRVGLLDPGRYSAAALGGAMLLIALIGGQLWYEPPTFQHLTPARLSEQGGYVEPMPGEKAVELVGGNIVLDPDQHPILGLPQARRFIVEAVDYTCAGCRRFNQILPRARRMLGPDVGVIVLMLPLSAKCNPALKSTPASHENACRLAKLAMAVWLAEPSSFETFHHWLFEHQDEMTAQAARARAAELVGEQELQKVLASGRPAKLIQRDLKIAQLLLEAGVPPQLPVVVAGNQSLEAWALEPSALAKQLRRALKSAQEQ